MSSTQEKLDNQIDNALHPERNGLLVKEGIAEGASHEWLVKREIKKLIDSAKREGAIEELRNLPSERHETNGWCDTGFFIDSEDRWERIKQLEQSEESI